MSEGLHISVYDYGSELLFCWNFKYYLPCAGRVIDYNADFVSNDVEVVVSYFKRLLTQHREKPVRLSVYDSGQEQVNTNEGIFRVLGNIKSNHNRKFVPSHMRRNRRSVEGIF